MVGGRDGGRRGGRQGGGQGPGNHDNRNQDGGRGRGRGRNQSGGRGRGRGAQGGRSGGGRAVGYRVPQLPSNPSSLQFIRSALKNCPNHKLMKTIEQMYKAWLSCWQSAESLPLDALKMLLSALSRLPFSASIAPPPLPAISKAVSALLSRVTQYGGGDEALDGNDETLEGVELVERVVTRLLKFTWDLKRDDVKDALDEMIAEADSSLNVRLTTHRTVRSRLTSLLNEMEKPWGIKVKVRVAMEIEQMVSVLDWRHPTVAWLADYRNFQPALLPKLQLPRSNGGRVYESSDEYFRTIVELWIGMTFVEGNNALLPHCTVKMGHKMCDQPLWPFSDKMSIHCRNSQCDRYATFVCAHRQHTKGYCSRCAGEYQQRLRGPPSKYASTHIYDGSIANVKYDGTLSIEQVASRRPPLQPIHWRTTKRLSSPNLIGIVRLANREASLRATDEIYWAEIIFQGKSFDEYKARERGRLTLRLLQYLDEPGNALQAHNPAIGDAVAIIDCQTFVPEFIPVLKALEKQRQMPVPFQNGALLNLCNHVSFGPNADSNRTDNDDYEDDSDGDANPITDTADIPSHDLIRKVVQLSLLDPIVDIRRDEALRNQLEYSLLRLAKSATLDPGQLRSFVEALMYPVHCTQGPPGTGKSYLGVVVVRALLVIRDLWKRKNGEIGDPPILVLSYKNHAIDEFLLDLLRSEPTLDHTPRHNTSFGRYYLNNGFKKLVRIGGGCSEPELESYRERNVAFSDPSVRKVSERIEACQELRDQWHKFRDCFTPIYEAQTVVAGDTKTLSPEERKTIQGAVPAVSSAVATLLKLAEIISVDDNDKALNVDDTEEKANESEDGESELVSVAPTVTPIEIVKRMLVAKPMLTNANIAVLHEGIKHYDPAIDPMEVLYQWISGFCPLPACAYSKSCLNVSFDKSKFCQEHSCKFTQDGEHFCLDAVVHKRLFCERHLCSAEKCKNCRMNDVQLFCEDHACFVCLAREERADVAVDEPPRNTCDRHPLCWGLEGMCVEVAEPSSSHCKMHAEDLYCKWVSQRGEPCAEIATTGQYCGSHHAEELALSERMAQMSTEKCQARTRKGKLCKAIPLSGSNFCRDHVGRSNLPVLTSPELSLPKADVQDKTKEETEIPKLPSSDAPLDVEPPQSSKLNKLKVEDAETDDATVKNDDVWSLDSDEDEGNFMDAVQYDNGDEVEESEHLQHMRDVFEVEDDDVEVEIEAVEESEEDEKAPWTSSDQQLIRPHAWHWDMALEERWNALFSVLTLWGDLNTRLQHAFAKQLEDLKVELQREILRANSRVYEGKSVIGGTITGCVSRLEAIRTTNPFAILVEEASEVMEPLLVSCFSSSTRKLEMIGDHMQLQPSVMGRIDFERVNKINISMFERLISAPQGNEVPSSVLSIQRRMRKSICDLTRSFYDDITTIEDHEVCGTKVIGGAKRKPGMVPLLDACEGGGREVPGVSPHVFFWTHSGRQERASVGLSRVNQQEAKMTCKLVQYLVHCGVPAKSIAVLTPYKGQLMLMRKMLMDKYGLKMMTKERDPRPVPSCFLSTVDRFQGDEADIVIISLVIDGKSRTPFVKLQNRMIVLLSRARLGMYVVGNAEYFGETSHWKKTFELLEKDAESDNTDAVECTIYKGPRIGAALPICCPEHRESVALTKEERDLKLGFCTVVCSVELSCSHECDLMCHWPQVNMHNKNCSVEVESPCSRHPRVLKCSAVTASAARAPISEALKKYQCDIRVDVSLPCGHNQNMKCYSHTEVEAGRSSWPVCNKEAIAPYVYSECKHILKCTCNEFDRYSKGHAPSCTEKVEYTPSCQHTVTQSCHDRQDYTNQVRRYVCKEKVKVSLPRCGHETVVSCPTAETLKQWTRESCPTMDFVQEGESYGPKDYFCKQNVKFQRRCGHYEMVRCERAFELAQSPSRCQEQVVVSNPECGHECSMTCFEEKRLRDKVAQYSGNPGDIDPIETVNEGDSSNYRNYGLNVQCSHKVTYARACGHKTKMKCSEARHITTVCEELMTASLPICGHVVRLPCLLNKHLKEWQPWQAQMPSIQLLHDDSVVEDTLLVPAARPAALRSVLKDCTAPVRYRRTTTCGHDVEMKCCDAFKLLQGKQTPAPCSIRVLKQLNCGHEAVMKCSDEVDSVVCHESVEKPCWNFTTCGSKVTVLCKASANGVQCATETEWSCPQGHSFALRLCSRGFPSDCPCCSSTSLDTVIKDTQRVMSDQKLNLWSPETARILPDMRGVTHVTMSLSSKRDFLVRKVKLLGRFKTGLDSSAKWSSPLFLPLEIPVFVVLSRKLQGRDIDKFEMKDFGSQQTLNGIEVYEATQENFKRVVSSGKASVLFGHLYSAKSLKNPTDIPKNKGKNGNNIRTWLSRQQSHGYDALYRDAKYGKKGGAWIVWHPYALFPVHRVEITDANRETIVSCLPEKTQVIQQPLKISFNKPTGVTTEEEEKPANTQAPTVISDEDIDKLRVLSASVSPFFEKLNVWYPWDGKSLSTGAAEAIPQRMEKTLISKLSFVPLNAANTTQQNPKTPFGGIKYVQNLQAQGKLKEDGNLFLALELLAVRNQDISETRSKLEKYVTRVCGEECGYAHPLVIVALARLAVRLSQTDIQRKLLHIFTALYPEASSLWLNEAELQLLQTTINQATASGSIVSGSVSVEDKWESLKSRYGCRSQAMEDLLKLVGLKKVKHAAVNMFRNAMILQQLSLIQRKKNSMAFNYCFVGNPGTGKTTVARLFAKILNDSMIRRTNTFVECTAQQLKDDGAAEFRLKLRKASGGVLFIDEAYELDPAGDFKGKPIVAELLTAAEDKRDDLSIILAGYEDDIQKKLYAYNDGLPSRFEEVVFEDFDSQDLEIVWDGLAQDRGWEYEKAIAKVACRRLAKAAGRKGFGNARAVRKLFEQVVKEAIAREDFDGTLKFQTVDLLGDRPSTNPKLQAVLDEVEEKTGWHKIKEEMKKLVRISDENYERELKGQETVPVCLNRLFLGNPGTGKTTCAGYYGRVLKALYFLSNGEVVKKTAGDFIGNHVGESQTKTAQILDMSKGKVLVIDEAYNLNDNLYGKQVLDVLVEKVQGTESDDLAVLLIGYEHEMLEMLRTHNPGLMRRFPPQYAFHFDDYTEHELLGILEWNCSKRSVTCPYEVAEALLKQLALQKTQPNFGNAGAVEQLLKHAMGKAMSRPMVNGMTVLALEDVGVDVSGEKSKEQKDPVKLLDKLYRMDEIKEQLIQLRNQMIVADREGSGLPEVGHFVFRGSPGTGKTTVARVMAEILHGMGVLATPKLVETSGLDLTGEHVGQTKQKVTDKLGEAKGGLLFIDEAYELGKGVYGEEAMTTLVAAMTDPSYVGMVIIIAGYPKDMDQMLDRNVGLKSRFTRFIDFPDWEAQDAVVFLSEKAESENFDVESEAVLSLQKTFVELKKLSNFGNGRDAVRVWKELLQYRSQRVVNEPEEERTITESDADKAGEAILVARRGGGVPGKGVASDEDPIKILDELYRMDQIRNQLSRLKMEMAVAEREGSTRPEIGHFVFRGSPGTGKTTVARVMAQILHAMSALGTTKLVETSGLDLTGEYVGQTKAKVTEKLVEAKGGLLFIDEAYELGKGMYGEEAMTTLVAAMTDPSYAGMVIVIAGYPKDMDVMLNRNAGLKSRFTRFIDFPDWEAEDGVAFLQAKAEKEEIEWGHGAEGILYQTFVELKKLDGFGNGRDAVRVWKELLQCRAQRVFDSPEEIRTITGKDAAMAGEIVLAARRPPDGPVLSQSSLPSDNSMVRTQDQQPPQTQQPLSELIEWLEPEQVTLLEQVEEKEALSAAAEEIVEVDAEEDPYTDEIEKDGKVERDPDVSDEDWEELERAKEAHAAHLEALKRARDQATREEERRRAQAKLEEERRRAAAIQEKIRQICPCPAGFKWYKHGSGWRCGGGSHFVSDAQLNSQFIR
ncbi:hypothetical protein PC129_g8833 [Phytophthora cactorum]|uniref:AAA+ ATPase domain-containing protein n=1 Tax=Phytophthora cactorum TaxID=29920 RepID=A0A329SF45_9STRA|nr:hypothetical protein Pcac1_g1075 [Phytophthora cactorum]KAG2821021.1 hypothetical protein PC112_g11531 [Phytophthora cactorum]KAG2824062.1 hypothetical protein PC111_g9982 [Phytophthora cactorum]KAG2861794.1 hypothetical protein PC113_g6867 [Phytophthora cactorum]KAG2902613.1 hypothetical protein PC114_g12661 [Phytophthora cactorum]